MLIIVVYDNIAERDEAERVAGEVRENQPHMVVGVSSEEDVRQEDIVSYLYWNSTQGGE